MFEMECMTVQSLVETMSCNPDDCMVLCSPNDPCSPDGWCWPDND